MNNHKRRSAPVFDEAVAIVDEAGVVEMVGNWMREDGVAPVWGVVLRSVLAGWLAASLTGSPLTSESVSRVLRQASADGEGINGGRVLAVTRRMLDVIDYSPLPEREGALTKAEFEAVLVERQADEVRIAEKRRRHLDFTNAFLCAQLGRVAELTGLKLDVALDDVMYPAGVTGIGRNAYQQLATTDRVSLEPDAAFVFRGAECWDPTYIWRYEVATLVSDSTHVPTIAVGLAGHSLGAFSTAVRELVGVLGRTGRSLDHVVGDRAYFSHVKPEFAREPLHDMGAKLVTRCKRQDEGRVQAVADGAIMVEGRWYRDDLPAVLRDAMKDFRTVSESNRDVNGTRVISWDVEWGAEERRNALVNARRKYEKQPRGAGCTVKYEQEYAYGSPEWRRLFARGQESSMQFARSFDARVVGRRTDTGITGAAAHGFLATLVVVATNAHSIDEWRAYHTLDEGNGLIADEYSKLYTLVESRIQRSMADWSRGAQPGAVARAERLFGWGGHWVVDHDDDPCEWEPNASTTVVNVVRADEEAADIIADALIAKLREQAETLLPASGDDHDLSAMMRVEVRFDFLWEFTMDEDEQWLPMPKEGLPLSAEATLVPSWLPRCASPNRDRG